MYFFVLYERILTYMYKFIIFLIVFTLFVFEIAVSLIFDRWMNSNSLILFTILVLIWLYSKIRNDIYAYHTLRSSSISQKIVEKKSFSFILSHIESYAYIFAWIGVLFLGVLFLIWNTTLISLCITLILICLIIGSVNSIINIFFTSL